ncbi:Nitrogen fixation regulation protein FixK [Pseudovibrio axinellae]|uniref:Nitrogen fixation regulation protein FixK n=1 Tax=Pseudovibrio axinellae TaxID=989403 RepID=A0A165T1W2_9HYPH|nr:Crp/Fnr family transcriptional regulator [Pseudovibrio axinellae]KZL05185.1 Nitrogen fixation regulation protein FixK [Pseudovibrio axinellae]SER51494.1 cAMP-binding domain of CRP or a regulatory subunit of cAMP-dependent protein kinases [Pseudovibrio axinellae]
MNEKRRKIAQNSLLLKSLPEKYVDTLLSMSSSREYDKGEAIFFQGEIATAIHVVVEGWVKLYRIAPNGGEAIVHVFTKGESFGEAVAIKEKEYPVSAGAVTTCEVVRIPSSALLNVIRKEPEVAITILASTFNHLHSLVSQLEQLKAQTGPQRVAEFLLELCGDEQGRQVVTLPYDKALIAGRLGMKPESLSRSFARLRSVGVQVKRNSSTIEDIERLRVFAETDHADAWSPMK